MVNSKAKPPAATDDDKPDDPLASGKLGGMGIIYTYRALHLLYALIMIASYNISLALATILTLT